jgi:hypothetical protein
MYKSNQARLKSYVSERRIEEANAEEHQDRLYEQIAADLGQEVQATALAKMAKRVVNKFGEDIQKPSLQMQTTGKPHTATDYLRQAIGEGKLSQIFDKIKKMDTTGLSKKEKIIVSDIKNKERRKYITDIFNERITPILEKKHKEFTDIEVNGKLSNILDQIETEFVDIVAGGDKSAVENIIEKAKNPEDSPKIGARKRGRPKNPAGAKLLEVAGKPTKQGELAAQLGIN